MKTEIKKKKVLVINPVFVPSAFPESYLIAKQFSYLENCDVTILSVKPNKFGRQDKSLNTYVKNGFTSIEYVGSTFTWILTRMSNAFNVRLLIDSYLLLSLRMIFSTFRILKRNQFDIVVTRSSPHSVHLIGLLIRWVYPKLIRKWVIHFSDPWLMNPLADNQRIGRYHSFLYKKILDSADVLIVPNQELAEFEYRQSLGTRANKLKVIPHSFDAKLYAPTTRDHKGTYIMAHFGNMYKGRTPKILFQVVASEVLPYLEESGLDLIIQFYGHYEVNPQHYLTREMSKVRIEVYEPIDYLESLKKMSESDALIVIESKLIVNPFFPSKIVDYLGSGVPIISINGNWNTGDIALKSGGIAILESGQIRGNVIEMVKRRLNSMNSHLPEIRKAFSKESVDCLYAELFEILM